MPDAAGHDAVDHFVAVHLFHLVRGIDAMQDHVADDRVGAVDDHLAIDHRPHVHDQPVFLDQAGVAPHDAGVVDQPLMRHDARYRVADDTPRVVFGVRAPAIADGVPVIAALCVSRFRNDARQPKDKQGTVKRFIQMLHVNAPLTM